MAQVHFNDLPGIRAKHNGKKIVFASGCFDLTHAGHALFFEDCKKYGDVLVVLVGNDEVIRRDKANRRIRRPVLNEHVRIKMVDALRAVDYTFLDHMVPAGGHPLTYVEYVLAQLKPDVYAINEDAYDIAFREAMVRRNGVELVVLHRWCPKEFEGISTTGIIETIAAQCLQDTPTS